VTTTITDTISPTATPTNTPYGEGAAIINPTQVTAASINNVMVITYTNGNTQWSPGTYGTIRIIIPAGWSAPSITPGDKGFYGVSVIGGALLPKQIDLIENAIVVRVRGLAAITGTITITFEIGRASCRERVFGFV
jgi:hypothetical protein